MSPSNPFPFPSPLQKVELRAMVAVARQTYERGWNSGTAGNFSIRGTGTLMWQSPSGVPKGALSSDGFIPVDFESVAAVGRGRPSAETPVHAAIYRLFPKAKAVVHVHCPHLVLMSKKGQDLVFEGKEMAKALGCHGHEDVLRIPVIPNTQDMVGLGRRLAEVLNPNVPLVILAEHGVYGWGRSAEEALGYVESAEFLCQTY